MQRSWQRSCARDPHTQILQSYSYRILAQRSWKRPAAYRDLAQEVLQDPDAKILTEILCKRSALKKTSRIRRSCTRGPTGSWCRHPDREILHKRSAYRDLVQVVRSCASGHTRSWCRDPDTEICTRESRTEILQKLSYRILVQRSWNRDLAQAAYRDLAQVVLQDLGAEILKERSWTRRPHTEILHKWPLEAADAEILTKTSCRSGATGFWCGDPDTDLAPTISNKENTATLFGVSCRDNFSIVLPCNVRAWYHSYDAFRKARARAQKDAGSKTRNWNQV